MMRHLSIQSSIFYIISLVCVFSIADSLQGRCCRHHDKIDITYKRKLFEKYFPLDSIDRIPCNISRSDFEQQYENRRQPVILQGCDKEWPSKYKWSFENIMNRFDNSTLWRAKVGDGDYDDEGLPWSEVVQAYLNNQFFYVFDNLDSPHGKTLIEDYSVPELFQNDIYQKFTNFPPDYGPMRWFSAGSLYSGTLPHVDPFETDAWNSVIIGMKWWVLFPQSISDDETFKKFVECNPVCSDDFISVFDWFYSYLWSIQNKQNVMKSAIHVFQRDGETLYIPSGMMHSVMNIEDTISITANYASMSNIHRVWDALIDANEIERCKFFCDVVSSSQHNISTSCSPCEFKHEPVCA